MVGGLSKKTALTLASKIRSYLLSNLFVRDFRVLVGGLSKKTAPAPVGEGTAISVYTSLAVFPARAKTARLVAVYLLLFLWRFFNPIRGFNRLAHCGCGKNNPMSFSYLRANVCSYSSWIKCGYNACYCRSLFTL